MRPIDIQPIGNELAIKWDDGSEDYLPLETLRRACPCAGCQGERDVMGNLHRGPAIKLTEASFKLVRLATVGGYAIQPVWGDGHSSGIFAYDLLKKIGAEPPASQPPA